MKKEDRKIIRAINRRIALETGDYWQNRSRQVPNKKKKANKEACRKNRRLDDVSALMSIHMI